MVRRQFNRLVARYLKLRFRRIEEIRTSPFEHQEYLMHKLVSRALDTNYGQRYDFKSILDYKDFTKAVPLVKYENICGEIENMMHGEPDVLWPGIIQCYAKSSGTTNDKSKYLPISDEFLEGNLIASSWDSMAIHYDIRPESDLFEAKSLVMGGSLCVFPENEDVLIGDVSAIMISKMPPVGRPFYTPDTEVALMKNWDQKIEAIAEQCVKENVVMFGGVPTWTIVLFNKILEQTGKSNMLEVWPNVKTYMHGGVGFAPYKKQFDLYLPTTDFTYMEVYNASEGYFGLQDQRDYDSGMLLLLNNDVFYEFIPLDQLDLESPDVIPLKEVELDKHYAIVISTTSGLWRYLPGDTVKFTSILPYRIKVSGRTKQFINVFGEEVMVSNTDQALRNTCEALQCSISEYTVGPVWLGSAQKGGHEWLIEFNVMPRDLNQFEEVLDLNLQRLNSDYEAKRFKSLALERLKVQPVPKGSFLKWLEKRGKVGGQYKIPRLDNTRKFVEEIGDIALSLQH